MILKKLVNILLNFVGRFDIIKLMLHSELKTLKPGTLLKAVTKADEHNSGIWTKSIPGIDQNNQGHAIPNGSIVMFVGIHGNRYPLPKILLERKILLVLPRNLELV